MANFKPLNNYSLFVLDRLIDKYHLKPPFLDVACGNGYLSKHLAKKRWEGVALDYSPQAVSLAKENLKEYRKVKVIEKPFSKASGKYNTVLMFDFLEHVEDDISILKKAHSLLSDKGFLVIAGPSNPKEWRWDDEFYGHYRRYTEGELREKLIKTHFKPILFYDYTFPFFWGLRRIYTGIKKSKLDDLNKEKQPEQSSRASRTKLSSFKYAWDIPIISNFLDKTSFFWLPIYLIQYNFFKKKISKGNAIFLLAKKK